jgi:hypothetical protein
MTFAAYDSLLGAVDLTLIDTAGPGPLNLVAGTGSGRSNFYNTELRGYDAALGAGTFIYAKFSGTIAAGVVVELTPSLASGVVINSATAWAGTTITGRPLAVSLAAGAAGQWGWFQIQGNAIVTVSGAPAAGNPVFWQAAGVPSPTVVASKQMVNAQFQTAVSQTVGTTVLSATQAVIYLNRPFAQGAIT